MRAPFQILVMVKRILGPITIGKPSVLAVHIILCAMHIIVSTFPLLWV